MNREGQTNSAHHPLAGQGSEMDRTETATIEASFDPVSPTAGLQEAIDALGPAGGCVRIRSGRWPLRRSLIVPSRVQLLGEGPTTELAISCPDELPLAQDARKGARRITVRGRILFAPGDAIGIVDNKRQWWDGTHAHVTDVEGHHIRLDTPIVHGLRTSEGARIVGAFPGITTPGHGDMPDRPTVADVVIRDLSLRAPNGPDDPYRDFTYAAIHLVNCHHTQTVGVTVSGWPSDGISVQGGSDVQVLGNQVSGCQGNGFHPGGGVRRSIWSQNTGVNNGSDGLFICGWVCDSVISDSVFSGNRSSGIGGLGYADCHHNVISNNICSENGMSGIQARDRGPYPIFRGIEPGNYLITGNMLRANSREKPGVHPAICLHDAKRFIVQGNRCADGQDEPTQTRGIVESGDSDWNLITGNHCLGMTEPVTVIGRNSRAEGNLY